MTAKFYWTLALTLDPFILAAYGERFESDVTAVVQILPPSLQTTFYVTLACVFIGYLCLVAYLYYSICTYGRFYRETVPTACIRLTTLRLVLLVTTFIAAALVDYSQSGQVMILLVAFAYMAMTLTDCYCYVSSE
jgi:hypothetical protein